MPLPGSRVEAERARSLERALSGVDGDTIRTWINRYTAPKNAATAAATAAPRTIYVEVDALARRHAAWQLADDLQKGALAPTQARQVQVALPQTQARQNFAQGGRDLALPAPATLPVRPARVVTATESNNRALQNTRATLDDFLADLRARQIALENAQDELARLAIEDRIRAATRGAVEAIELEPVSPEVALELSNLRLQLLAQLSVPAAQQAAATAKIEAIEARLNEIWAAQTAAQAERLRAVLEELPRVLRREGLAALDAAALRRQRERAALNAELRATVEARLRGAAPASDAQILRLFLPPARVPRARSVDAARNFFQTRSAPATSAPPRNDVVIPGTRALGRADSFGGPTIAELRAQARRDARVWARNWALSRGATLGDSQAPNRTAQAVNALFEKRS